MEHRTRTRRDSRRLVKFLATFCLYDCSLGVRGQTPVPQNGVRPREIGVQLSWATDFAMALPSILFLISPLTVTGLGEFAAFIQLSSSTLGSS